VNRNFQSWLKDKLGKEVYDRIAIDKLRSGSLLMKEFELAKSSFRGSEKIWLPLPNGIVDDESKGIEDGEIILTAADMQGLFNPCVNRILELVGDQIAAVKAAGFRVKVQKPCF
jgi:hypothetical protein